MPSDNPILPPETLPASVAVKVSPRASREEIAGFITDSAGKSWLHVRLTVPPEDGKANKALLKLLAKHWKLPQSSLEIVSGDTARHKIIRVTR